MEHYEEQDYSSEKFSAGVWKKILSKVFKRKKNIIIMIISVILLAGLDILNPLLNSRIVEVFFSGNPQFDKTWIYISLYVLCAISYAIVIYLFIKMAGIVEVEVAHELREEAFIKLQELPFSYYDKTAAGCGGKPRRKSFGFCSSRLRQNQGFGGPSLFLCDGRRLQSG